MLQIRINAHSSYFLILDCEDIRSSNELNLNCEASEWLFHVKFWDEINSEYHTDFAQYEEETLAASMIGYALQLLDGLKDRLVALSCDEIVFRYGWKQDMSELLCTVSKKTLVDELAKLASLLARAAKNGLDVYCQL